MLPEKRQRNKWRAVALHTVCFCVALSKVGDGQGNVSGATQMDNVLNVSITTGCVVVRETLWMDLSYPVDL